jgi:protein-L-isoaspartate(D-aspartate) O-methyltransferase
MVEMQLLYRGIIDEHVLDAMRTVPREAFMPYDMEDIAYADNALPIGEGQTISQPYMVAIMTELMGLKGEEKVLEIGTGSGYQAAILSLLAEKVITIERIPELAERATVLFKKLGYKNIDVIVGDGTLGYKKEAPYDAIIVTAAAPNAPKSLLDQLEPDGGRLIIPLGDRYEQVLMKITRHGNNYNKESSVGCRFVPLIGKEGWEDA